MYYVGHKKLLTGIVIALLKHGIMVLYSILFISAKYNMTVVVSYRPGRTTELIVYNVVYTFVNCLRTRHVNVYRTSSVPIGCASVQARTLHVYLVGTAFINLVHLLIVYVRTRGV